MSTFVLSGTERIERGYLSHPDKKGIKMNETSKRGCGKPMGSSGYLMSFCGDVSVPLCSDCRPFEPRKWTRRPDWDEAEQLTFCNTAKVAAWCGGRVGTRGPLVLANGLEALVSDWIVRTPTGEFRVMTDEEFHNVYEPAFRL